MQVHVSSVCSQDMFSTVYVEKPTHEHTDLLITIWPPLHLSGGLFMMEVLGHRQVVFNRGGLIMGVQLDFIYTALSFTIWCNHDATHL